MRDTRGGKLIRRYRDAAGFTRDDLAGIIGCHPSLVSLIEGGYRSCRAEMIHAIADACGREPDDLIAAFAFDRSMAWINQGHEHCSDEQLNRIREIVLLNEPIAA